MIAGTAALVYALAVAQPSAQERQPRAPQTDQTVPVTRGTRLSVDNFAGEVVVRTWDKDSLRVQARHASRTRINIRPGESGVRVSASSQTGPNGSVDYEITAPAWMPIKIEGQFNYVTVDGAQNEVSVATVKGDISIKGGSGSITGRTIQGEVVVDGARGKINVSSVNEGIKISGTSGDITAETTNGSITLTRIESGSVDVATVNGNIVYDGTLPSQGRFSFTTHNGDIVMTVPENANATFSVRTYNGEFSTALSLKGPHRSEVRHGRRVTYTLGNGGADVELESFGGAIRLRRAGVK
jgi:DUF4097 and DUF4098 domain-containing protein YvlB